MYREAPIKNGMFDYNEFTRWTNLSINSIVNEEQTSNKKNVTQTFHRILKHGAKEGDEV